MQQLHTLKMHQQAQMADNALKCHKSDGCRINAIQSTNVELCSCQLITCFQMTSKTS